MSKEFITGNQAVVKGAIASGAEILTGYPITPTTEILEEYAKSALNNPKLKLLQTEDEMSAGFAMIGAILAGKKAFTATAGPGHVLMQDAFSMAESMRIPTVAFINQRGGPSTGTVIYSQQEVDLACHGGNGEGLRIVYSVGSPQEMYDYAIRAFNSAWKYRFPTFVLSDGYSAKTLTQVEIYNPHDAQIDIINASAYLLNEKRTKITNIRNTYNFETELNVLLMNQKKEFDQIKTEIVEYEDYKTLDAEIVIFSHGICAVSAKQAVDELRNQDVKVGLFRPITLNPFPKDSAKLAIKNNKKIVVVESALGQFQSIVRDNLYGETNVMKSLLKPAVGITPEEIVEYVKKILKETHA